MDWRTTYPSLATMREAGLQTLLTWDEHLPAAQTDVERTLRRRLSARINELAGPEIREHAPDIADKLNALIEKMQKLGIKPPFGRM